MAGGEVPTETHIAGFLAICLLLGGIFRTISHKTHFVYTPLILFLGIFISYMMDESTLNKGYNAFLSVDKHGLLTIFVPILLFEPALKANWHQFT